MMMMMMMMMMMTRNNYIDIAEMRTRENIECNVQYQILTEKHKTNGKNSYNRSRPLYVCFYIYIQYIDMSYH